jgi:hypothetical protein
VNRSQLVFDPNARARELRMSMNERQQLGVEADSDSLPRLSTEYKIEEEASKSNDGYIHYC